MRASIAALALFAVLIACEAGTDEEVGPGDTTAMADDTLDSAAPPDSAVAIVRNVAGDSLGAIVLAAREPGVALWGDLRGLPPGEHGFHIHETGSCEPPDFASAGDHLAPFGSAHGFDAEGGPHAGDLRNVTAGPDSMASVDQTTDRLALRTGQQALLDADGSALIVHAGPDDYETQPSGGSGDPIACGVIEG